MPIECVFVLDALDAGSLTMDFQKNIWLVIFSNLIFKRTQFSETTYNQRLRNAKMHYCRFKIVTRIVAFNVTISGIIIP